MTLILVGIVLFFSIRLRKTNIKLLHLQQARDKFYTIIAHDLRLPMKSLNDMGVLLQHLIKEGKVEELDRVIKQIEKMRYQSNLLLNNLFEWGKSDYFVNQSVTHPIVFEGLIPLQTIYNYYGVVLLRRTLEMRNFTKLCLIQQKVNAVASTIKTSSNKYYRKYMVDRVFPQ